MLTIYKVEIASFFDADQLSIELDKVPKRIYALGALIEHLTDLQSGAIEKYMAEAIRMEVRW